MSTPGSHCEPPANNIVEPLTFTVSKMVLRGKVIVFQSCFSQVASASTFSVLPRGKKRLTKKKRTEKKINRQASANATS